MAPRSLAPARRLSAGPAPARTDDRKADHLRIAAGEDVSHRAPTGLATVRLRHRALPEHDLDGVTLSTRLFGQELAAPLLISAMTGGTPAASVINRRLLDAAAEHGVGLTLGSGRRLLEDLSLRPTYRPAGAGRPPLMVANLGAGQLRGRHGPAAAERLVELLETDGLSVHLNPLQEAIQPEGEARYAGITAGLAATVDRLAPRPVLVKEVGFGLSARDVEALAAAGVAAIDVAGAGGTNWALVEGQRDPWASEVASAFSDWGQTTLAALGVARVAAPGVPLIASGGLTDGVDCAKCLALGARACAMARELLLAAQAGEVSRRLAIIIRQLQIATWLAGATAVGELDHGHLQ